MRLIFWFLLASNVGMLVLRYGVGVPAMFHPKEPIRVATDRALLGADRISLLGEGIKFEPESGIDLDLEADLEVGLEMELEEQAAGDLTATTEADESVGRCKSIGPFEVRSIADSFVSRLATLDVSSKVENRQVSAGEGYWVYLEPFEDKKAARQKLLSLQEGGLDCYIIPRGKLAGGISLGMFSQLGLANKRILALKRMGYEAKTQKIERTFDELWVVLAYKEDQKVGGSVWKMLLKGKDHLKEEENLCLGVDSL